MNGARPSASEVSKSEHECVRVLAHGNEISQVLEKVVNLSVGPIALPPSLPNKKRENLQIQQASSSRPCLGLS